MLLIPVAQWEEDNNGAIWIGETTEDGYAVIRDED